VKPRKAKIPMKMQKETQSGKIVHRTNGVTSGEIGNNVERWEGAHGQEKNTHDRGGKEKLMRRFRGVTLENKKKENEKLIFQLILERIQRLPSRKPWTQKKHPETRLNEKKERREELWSSSTRHC